MIEYNINFDPVAGRKYYSSIVFTTGDVNGYKLKFDFGKMDLSDKTIIVKAKRADGMVVEIFGSVAYAGEVMIPGNAYAIPGELELEIGVYADGENEEENECVTACVVIATVREGFGDSDMTGSETHNALLELIADFGETQNILREFVNEAKSSAATADENADSAAKNADVAIAAAEEATAQANNAARHAKAAEDYAEDILKQLASGGNGTNGGDIDLSGFAKTDLSNVSAKDFENKVNEVFPGGVGGGTETYIVEATANWKVDETTGALMPHTLVSVSDDRAGIIEALEAGKQVIMKLFDNGVDTEFMFLPLACRDIYNISFCAIYESAFVEVKYLYNLNSDDTVSLTYKNLAAEENSGTSEGNDTETYIVTAVAKWKMDVAIDAVIPYEILSVSPNRTSILEALEAGKQVIMKITHSNGTEVMFLPVTCALTDTVVFGGTYYDTFFEVTYLYNNSITLSYKDLITRGELEDYVNTAILGGAW